MLYEKCTATKISQNFNFRTNAQKCINIYINIFFILFIMFSIKSEY